MRFSRFVCIAFLASACAEADPYPNLPAVPAASGDYASLEGWRDASVPGNGLKYSIKPAATAFGGAHSWLGFSPERDPRAATKHVFSKVGFTDLRVTATAPLNLEALRVIDDLPNGHGHAITVAGAINNQPARGVALVLYGKGEDGAPTSGVHAFMAPEGAYQALGGYAIPAVRWLEQTAEPGMNMRLLGDLPDEQAAAKLANSFYAWIRDSIIPAQAFALQTQMQTLQNMQSWNSAAQACAGDSGCQVQPDGAGSWQAVRD